MGSRRLLGDWCDGLADVTREAAGVGIESVPQVVPGVGRSLSGPRRLQRRRRRLDDGKGVEFLDDLGQVLEVANEGREGAGRVCLGGKVIPDALEGRESVPRGHDELQSRPARVLELPFQVPDADEALLDETPLAREVEFGFLQVPSSEVVRNPLRTERLLEAANPLSQGRIFNRGSEFRRSIQRSCDILQAHEAVVREDPQEFQELPFRVEIEFRVLCNRDLSLVRGLFRRTGLLGCDGQSLRLGRYFEHDSPSPVATRPMPPSTTSGKGIAAGLLKVVSAVGQSLSPSGSRHLGSWKKPFQKRPLPARESRGFVDVEEGTCYLLEEPKPVLAFRLLELAASERKACFCITRQSPERVRMEHRLGGTRCLWLSEIPGEGHVSGKALASLAKRIEDFVTEQGGRGLVLLDGLEYLVENNGFDSVLAFVEHLNEFVMTRQAVLLIPVSPKAIGEREVARLERDLKVPDVPGWLDEIERRVWAARLDEGT